MLGAPGSNTEAGPPDRMMALGILGQHLINRHRMGHQFRIHVRLTHAAGDQLGVLGSEINNKNRTVAMKLSSFIGVE